MTSVLQKIVALLCFIPCFIPVAHANKPTPPQGFLRDFSENIRSAMEAPILKFGHSIDAHSLDEKIEACRQHESRDVIMKSSSQFEKLNAVRKIGRGPYRTFAEQDTQLAIEFLELPDATDNISELNKYREASIEVQPWSGDYWAIRTGMTAKRYADEKFPDSTTSNTWQEAFDYFIANPSAKLTAELLSPAEKYDRLVGDENYTLTQSNWKEGKQYNDQFGEVESWMGICHGWAPAAFMEPRPTHTVEVDPYNQSTENPQQKIIFQPDDLKALASLKWATGVTVKKSDLTSGTHFIGGRCNVKEPKKDPDTGRITDPDCFDLNPALWHIVVINQIAREKRSFVIDANFDYEVWNQPVSAFSYKYFNPKTLAVSDDLDSSRVKLNDPEFKDKFKKFRTNNKAVEVVGIRMSLTYTVETSPRGQPTDAVEFDATRTAQYHYDLELDAQGQVVGGEWYQNRHPDFVWMPIKSSTALNNEDLYVDTAEKAKKFAPRASLSNAPLRFVLDDLLQQAHEPQ